MKIEGVVTAMISEYPFKLYDLDVSLGIKLIHSMILSTTSRPQTFDRACDNLIEDMLLTVIANSSEISIPWQVGQISCQ